MDFDQLLIDGYNLLHQPEFDDLRRGGWPSARQQLVRRIEPGACRLAVRAAIVFDGREAGRDAALDTPHFEVLFSPANKTADGVIEQRVHDAKNPERILVVTSDWTEQRVVSAFGASVMSCRDFLLRCAEPPAPLPRPRRGPAGATLGEFFPE